MLFTWAASFGQNLWVFCFYVVVFFYSFCILTWFCNVLLYYVPMNRSSCSKVSCCDCGQNGFKGIFWFYMKGEDCGILFLFCFVLFCLRVEYMFSLAVKAQSRQHDKWVSVVKVKLILPSLTWAIEGGSFIVPGKVIRQSNCILYCPGTSALRLLEQFIYHGRYSMFCLSALTHPHCWPARRFW